MFSKSRFTMLGAAAAAAMVAIGGGGVTQATLTNFTWLGTINNDFSNGSNYLAGTAPVAGTSYTGTSPAVLDVQNGSGSYMLYNSSLTTTFSNNINIGNGSTTGGNVTVSSGDLATNAAISVSSSTAHPSTLTVNSGGTTSGFQLTVGLGGTLSITGGTVTSTTGNANYINGGVVNLSAGSLSLAANASKNSLEVGVNNTGTLNISGSGAATVAGTLAVGYSTNTPVATGSITLTGGSITAYGLVDVGTNTTYGVGTITLGTGSGVFEMTSGISNLSFASSSDYINFLTGSLGSISINGASLSDFQGLVTSGYIKYNGGAASTSQFAYTTSGTQGIYSLSVPEPATLALMAMTGSGILLMGRKRKYA